MKQADKGISLSFEEGKNEFASIKEN